MIYDNLFTRIRGKLDPVRPDPVPSPFRRAGVIFVHVPKCAGSTVLLSMLGYRVGHRSISSYWEIDPGFTRDAFKFSFVRHPCLRAFSAYTYLKAGGMSRRDEAYVSRSGKEFSSFDTLVEALENPEFRDSILHFRPQFQFLSNPARTRYSVYMDYVGKTERIGESLADLEGMVPPAVFRSLERLREVRLNGSARPESRMDEGTFRRLRTVYSDDFELFGYDGRDAPGTIMSRDAGA